MEAQRLIPLAEALEYFITDARARNLADKTIHFYQWHLEHFINWLDVTCLSELTSNLIKSYFVHLQSVGWKKRSVHAAARSIRAWCNFCAFDGILDPNPFDRVKMPKLPRNKLPSLTQDEIDTVLAACRDARDTALVLLLLDTGCRVGEVAALNADDMDMKAGVLIVNNAKGDKARPVYIGHRTRKALLKYWLGNRPTGKEGLFRSNNGKGFMTASGLQQVIRSLKHKSGVSKLTPHNLRRTFAILMLRAGCDLYRLAALMGHEDISVLRAYLDLVESDAQEAHAQFGIVDRLKGEK